MGLYDQFAGLMSALSGADITLAVIEHVVGVSKMNVRERIESVTI